MKIIVNDNNDADDIVRGVKSVLFLLGSGYGAGIDKPTNNDTEAAAFYFLSEMLDSVSAYLSEVK